MAIFAKGIARWVVLSAGVAVLVLVPPEILGQGPGLCLWKRLFHLTACPACGSTRALAAFFHGRFGDALAFNRNVIVTAPCLLGLLGWDTLVLIRKLLCCVKIQERLRGIAPAALNRHTLPPGDGNP